MKLIAIAICALASVIVADDLPTGGNIWAVLVAGSNTYGNYRHQADVYHAYQILHQNGIPDERIIVMHYDDIAYNVYNPTPGIVINHPDGSDVYAGVPKDYTGTDVNPTVFSAVLTGDASAVAGIGSGKVLQSGTNDHVFVNFVDHGAYGLVAFPTTELYASELMAILATMDSKKLYGELTFYLEACEAGSMFLDLPDNVNIYATTAANPDESSYACYYDEYRETYLGDVYSVNWMENSDANNLSDETLETQYEIVRDETEQSSHVMQYGQLSISSEAVGDFLGLKPISKQKQTAALNPQKDAVPADDVYLQVLKQKLAHIDDEQEKAAISEEIRGLLAKRRDLKRTVNEIVWKAMHNAEAAKSVTQSRLKFDIKNRPCYEEIVKYFSANCYPLSQNAFAMKQVFVFANMCEMNINPALVKQAMDQICSGPITGVN